MKVDIYNLKYNFYFEMFLIGFKDINLGVI